MVSKFGINFPTYVTKLKKFVSSAAAAVVGLQNSRISYTLSRVGLMQPAFS